MGIIFSVITLKKYFSIGMRTLKTAISVLICLLIYKLFYYLNIAYGENIVVSFVHDYLFGTSPSFACIASVICLQDTIKNSVEFGISRIIGSVLGGIAAVLLSLFNAHFFASRGDVFVCVFGVIFLIWLCNIISHKEASSITVITFLIIIIGIDFARPLVAAINRTFGTVIGASVSIIVNKTIKSPGNKQGHPFI